MSDAAAIERLHRRVARSIPAGVERWPVGDQAAWHARRQGDVTASQAGALYGVHEFTSFYDLYHQKAGTLPRSDEDSPAMRRGRLLEDDILQVIAEDRPDWHVAPCGFYYRHPASRLGATPDAVAFDPTRPGFGIIQVKSVEPGVYAQKWTRDEDGVPRPPDWIVIQAIQEAWLTGASWAAAAPGIVSHGFDAHVIPVPIHTGIIAGLQSRSRAFWRRIETGDTPDPDYRTDGATIAGLYPDDNGQEIDLTSSNELPVLADEFDAIRERMRAGEQRLDEIKAAFRHALGPNEAARIASGRRITLRTQTRAARWHEGWTGRVLRIGRRNDGC